MLDPARMRQFQVLLAILLHLLLALHVLLELSTRAPVSFVLNVEELHREIVLEVDKGSVVEHHVEFMCGIGPLGSQ